MNPRGTALGVHGGSVTMRRSSFRPFPKMMLEKEPRLQDKTKTSETKPTIIEISHSKNSILWCELPVVKQSSEYDTLSPKEKTLQEAKFEILYTEATFLRQMQTFERSTQSQLLTPGVLGVELNERDRKTLSAHISSVRETSQEFLDDLELCWQDGVLLPCMFSVIYSHAAQNFQSYVKFCINQAYAREVLDKINCRSTAVLVQTLNSYLILPTQRVTRLPLLVQNVLDHMQPDDIDYPSCRIALEALRKITEDCNEDVRKEERMRQILKLSDKIKFPSSMTALALLSESRWLVRSNDVIVRWHEQWDGEAPHAVQMRQPRTMFLFNDFFVVAKKKSFGTDSWTVTTYCTRYQLEIKNVRRANRVPSSLMADQPDKFMLFVTIFENHEGNSEQMVVSLDHAKDRDAWIEDMEPPAAESPSETVYAAWARPLVQAVFEYQPLRPDELHFQQYDKLRVFRKFDDGWYEGEHVLGGQRGLFPESYVKELESAHSRAFAGMAEF